jgi:glycosyltransferase involved in cell wall biosynthesis
MSPSFTIVVPVLNQVRFVEDCLISLIKQEDPSLEIVVIDGGSTDGTVQILRRFQKHIRFISEPDEGQSDAINKGFRMATGDWVGWLNADDFLLAGALAGLRSFVVSHPQLDVVYGASVFVDEDGHFQRLKSEHVFDRRILLYYGCYIPSSGGAFFKRSILDQDTLLDSGLKVTMDFEIFTRLSCQGRRFGYLEQGLAAFRWHGSNRSLNGQDRRIERSTVQRKYAPRSVHVLLPLLSQIYRFKRVMRRLRNGGLVAELGTRKYLGVDLKWFGLDEAVAGELALGRFGRIASPHS